MKKALILLCALLFLVPSALAAGAPLIVDGAGLLTQDALQALTAEAERISAEHQMDVAIVTVYGLDGKTVRDYAADTYDYEGYGQGPDNSGILLLLSMEERDWFIVTTGAAIDAFTDYGLDAIEEDIIPYFSKGDYAAGFARFLRDAERFIERYEAGEPYDIWNKVQLKTPMERTLAAAPFFLIGGAAAAVAGILILMRGMNTARFARSAAGYVRAGSMAITRAGDYFLYRTQTRVRIEKNQSGSGGGSSTFKGSSGTSHGGKGGKF